MKAIRISISEEQTQLIDDDNYAKPKISKSNQILIKTKAVAVNPIDLQMTEGKNEIRMLSSDILGREAAGIVEEIGEDVKHFRKGDEVYLAVGSMGSNGAFADYVVVAEDIVAHKPKSINFSQAAALPIAYVTAWQAVSRLPQSKESSVLIMGASGSVGKALINLLHYFGFKKITATAGNDYSIGKLMQQNLDRDQIVSYRLPDLQEKIVEKNGGLYDIVIDCIGGDMTEMGANILKREGLFVDITNLRIQEADYLLFQKAAVIMNISRYAESELHYKYGEILTELSNILNENPNWILQETLDLGKLSVENLQKAFEIMQKNTTMGKKLILSVE